MSITNTYGAVKGKLYANTPMENVGAVGSKGSGDTSREESLSLSLCQGSHRVRERYMTYMTGDRKYLGNTVGFVEGMLLERSATRPKRSLMLKRWFMTRRSIILHPKCS